MYAECQVIFKWHFPQPAALPAGQGGGRQVILRSESEWRRLFTALLSVPSPGKSLGPEPCLKTQHSSWGLFAAILAQMGTVEFGCTGIFLTRLGDDNSIRFEVILAN